MINRKSIRTRSESADLEIPKPGPRWNESQGNDLTFINININLK